MTLFLSSLLLISCDSDDKEELIEEPEVGILDINFSAKSSGVKATGTDYSLNAVKKAIFSIKQDGEYIEGYLNKSFEFSSWDNTSSSVDPISLEVGTYILTLFELRNEDNITTYATPYSGSEVATLVENPVNIEFSIIADQPTTLTLEVLRTLGLSPRQFGYDVLNFTDNTPNYQLSNFEKIIDGNYIWKHFVDNKGIPSYSEVYAIDEVTKEAKSFPEKRFTHSFDENNRLIKSVEYRTFTDKAVTITISERNEDGSWKKLKWIDADASYIEREYNENLQEIANEYYSHQGEFEDRNEFSYNDQGLKSGSKYYNENRILESYREYEYNTNGNIAESLYYNKDSEYTGGSLYEYNSENLLIKREYLNNEKVVRFYISIEYDSNNRIIKRAQYNTNDEIDEYFTYEYAAEGWLLSMKYFRNDGTLYYSKTFNKEGNIIATSRHESMTFIYDAIGRLIGAKTFREDGSLKQKEVFKPTYYGFNNQSPMIYYFSYLNFGEIYATYYYDENEILTKYISDNSATTYYPNGNRKKTYHTRELVDKDNLENPNNKWYFITAYNADGRRISQTQNSFYNNNNLIRYSIIYVDDNENGGYLTKSSIDYEYNNYDKINRSYEYVRDGKTNEIIKHVTTDYTYNSGIYLIEYIVREYEGDTDNLISTKVYDSEGNLLREE